METIGGNTVCAGQYMLYQMQKFSNRGKFPFLHFILYEGMYLIKYND